MIEIAIVDSTIVKELKPEEEINEGTDQALDFQNNIDYWITKIKDFIHNSTPPRTAHF